VIRAVVSVKTTVNYTSVGRLPISDRLAGQLVTMAAPSGGGDAGQGGAVT
jgi:hypothetical protein